jgi:hypothetical protein
MTPDVRSTDLQDFLAGHHVWYEFRPHYIVVDQRPPGASPVQRMLQAGFDVDLYAELQTEQFGLDNDQKAHEMRLYFESVAKQIQTEVGQQCTVEIMPYRDMVILDTHDHFRPEAMLQVQIGHCRGMDQPSGAPEDQALHILEDRLHDLGITRK